ELPFDKDYVCYVWFDALLNYVSAVGYLRDDEKLAKWWPASIQLIGKDILTTHSVYWPTMLKAMDLPLPKTIFAHGWWLTGTAKMSKSLGNVVNPMEMVEKYGIDAFRYFLLSEMTPGQDASFTEDVFVTRYNSDLANDLGNFLSRVIKLTGRSCGGAVPAAGALQEEDLEFMAAAAEAVKAMPEALAAMKIDRGLDAVLNIARAGNRYFEKTAPWKLAKEGNTERLNTVLNVAAEALFKAAVLLNPVMPEKTAELGRALGYSAEEFAACRIAALDGADHVTGRTIADIGALFPRVEIAPAEEEKAPKAEKKAKPAEKEAALEGVKLVTIDEFFQTQLKTATVLQAEKIEGADKLLKLQIDIAGETRQLVAGIAKYYEPETLIGRTIVVVANLQPAKIRGIESRGMLLAAKSGKELRLITVDGPIASGASVG
ncbi:MAG: methionine--tRNA ligase subunit beta, partial [Lentisphaeria bacterium]|nr:methionine--tRNA ligase subunit beta [Lentisphaeria bacterium]